MYIVENIILKNELAINGVRVRVRIRVKEYSKYFE